MTPDAHAPAVTPLHGWHRQAGARMAPFAGFEMPLWYASAKSEHLAVIQQAGLFDTCHMDGLRLTGADARSLLQSALTNDLDACIGAAGKPLVAGRAVYGAFLRHNGHVLDDAIVFMAAENDYLVVVNASMGADVARHLEDLCRQPSTRIEPLAGRMAKIDIQGPAAPAILAGLLEDGRRLLEPMPYFSFAGHFLEGAPGYGQVRLEGGPALMVSRTGYTGEVGFELFCHPRDVQALWQRLLDAGRPSGLRACGLASRDSLRAGAVLPLSHQDIGPWPFVHHPWSFALPWNATKDGFRKPFVGDAALLAALADAKAPRTYPFVGYDPRKVDAAKAKVLLDEQGPAIGTVLTCTTDVAIDRVDGQVVGLSSPDRPQDFSPRGLCCGFVRVDRTLAPGTRIVLSDGRRALPVQVTANIRPHRTARRPLADFFQHA